jgi:hypothetical protein
VKEDSSKTNLLPIDVKIWFKSLQESSSLVNRTVIDESLLVFLRSNTLLLGGDSFGKKERWLSYCSFPFFNLNASIILNTPAKINDSPVHAIMFATPKREPPIS